jgi:serine/threonine protein kinase
MRGLLRQHITHSAGGAYMCPERARGESAYRRTDIPSPGDALCETLTGKRPFESKDEQALVYSMLNEDPTPMREWRAEKWEPDSLAHFYRSIGVKYILPVAVQHDNFDNNASTFQPWISVIMGPHRDIVGDWKQAAEKQRLRFGVSSHSDRFWDWFSTSHAGDDTEEKRGIPYDC